MTKVLCTGSAGFIGSNLVKECLKRGWEVDGVDDLSNGQLAFVPTGVNQITADFSDQIILDSISTKKYDYVFHLAAIPRVSFSVEQPAYTNDVNVSRTLKLIEACIGNVKRFVFASSCSIYGNAENVPTPESEKKAPRSPYALQKLIVEDYLKLYDEYHGLESISLRFFNVFGPNQLGDSPYATAVASWLNAIHRNQSMRSDGDGTQSRDMVHVDNVVHACILAALNEKKMGAQQFNVGTGTRVTNSQILNYLLKKYPNSTSHNAPWRPGDVMHTQADLSLIQSTLGYQPVREFWEGLESTINWIENNKDLFFLGIKR